MNPPEGRDQGYSMIELMLVLAIVAIMALVGTALVRPRTNDSVRSVMGEVEGVLLNAQHAAGLSAQDLYVSTNGSWTGGTLIIDARPMVTTATSTLPPVADLAPGNAATRLGSDSECFRSRYLQNDRDHRYAGIDTTGAWLVTALGSATDLKNTTLMNTAALAGFKTALGAPLCTGAFHYVVLNSISRNFVTGFCVVVVGINNGTAVANGPVGIIVAPAGGANLYKYFKPNGSNTWGRM